MIDQTFIDQYTLLLIKQYWEKPRARAEIEAMAGSWSEIYTILDRFSKHFDLDRNIDSYLFDLGDGTLLDLGDGTVLGVDENIWAEGDRLDKIGSIVGLPRNILGPPFNDDDYRFFIRLKIANNVVFGTMIDDNRLSIQDVILFAFGGGAYVVDRQDMSLELLDIVGQDETRIQNIVELDLLPKPAGVRYAFIEQIFDGLMFGVSDNGGDIPSNVDGFGELDDATNTIIGGEGGQLAELFEV